VNADPKSFDLNSREDGWFFRYPAGDESAAWSGPYPTRKAAEDAAVKACEAYIAGLVALELGIA
jgi:hypothetical protein